MKHIQLIATDMDGTLLRDGHHISTENIHAIQSAQQLGIKVVVATGRDYTEAITPLKDAGIRLPLICVNGADIRDVDGTIIAQQTFSNKEFYQIKEILESEKMYYEIYTTKGAFTNNPARGLDVIVSLLINTGNFASYDQVMTIAEKRFSDGGIDITHDYEAVVKKKNCALFKFWAFTEDDNRRLRVRERLQREMNIAVSSSARENLEITPKTATKGHGLRKMADYFGISINDTMAIGDNFNDVPMMKVASFAVAMGNAEEKVKAVCDMVTASNTDDGVAKAIYHILKR